MASNDLINFDIIEGQKENIQALPSGRSAKKLAELFSASPLQPLATPTPSDTKNVNDCIRAEYEAEIAAIAESDDPLDIYDRYVRWTLDAYPSAQATPQSQLHTVLERATKSFVNAPQYKNDPRYLKLWLHYIHFFSDAPRETFVFLSRHSIGETLALFYEEYAAWLEGAGRWAQAEEVYKLGIEREARPTSRLLRKFGEFEQRRDQQTGADADADAEGPSSPALPTVRPALAAKANPFAAAAAAARDPQAPRPNSGVGGQAPVKPARAKLAIFSDADAAPAPPALSARGPESKGWDNIGSLADRKKENVVEPKPWAGETLKAGGKKSSAPKMAVFRDTSSQSQQLSQSHIAIHHSKVQVTVNLVNGKKERVFVDLRAVYPTPDDPGTELSFEEVWAANRGWLHNEWEDEITEISQAVSSMVMMDENSPPPGISPVARKAPEKLMVHHDVIRLDENGAPIFPKSSKSRKKKPVDLNETQIIKAKLDSPSRPKMRRKHTAEPTMTLHTKAATDDIYDIFNAPLQSVELEDNASEGDYETDDDYTSGAESTGTTRHITTSEAGDENEMVEGDEEEEEEEEEEEGAENDISDAKSVSEWSDFSTRRHIPALGGDGDEEEQEDVRSRASDLIDINDHDSTEPFSDQTHNRDETPEEENSFGTPPLSPEFSQGTGTSFVPIPPEDYVPARRPYRDPVEAANNRLPFMTPITERTEMSLDITSRLDLHAKTPCKKDFGRSFSEDEEDEEDEEDGEDEDEDMLDLDPPSSPLRDISDDDRPIEKDAQPLLQRTKEAVAAAIMTVATQASLQIGPIIKDDQCNPVNETIRSEILANIHPPLTSYPGFYDHRTEKYEKGAEIRKFTKAIAKGSTRRSTDKTATFAIAPVLDFPDIDAQYTIRKELGKGAFAPVYLVDNSSPLEDRHEREALKMEAPPSSWEFYMMRLTHARLGQTRAADSLSPALEMHLYQDEGFLLLPYFQHGTLLDVINLFRAEPAGVMDEQLAMFFSIELLRTVEALHERRLLHGDLKADNCLLRLDSDGVASRELDSQWSAEGSGGWDARGVTLIDFGRAIDMDAFRPDVRFIADWKMSAQDCAEMKEGRPWTWQIDYHGLAGIIHCLLFGKYIDTVRCDGGGGVLGTAGGGRRYKIRESLKRYWQTEIWGEAFDVLLNPGAHLECEEGGRMPVVNSMRMVRERMERWLEGSCERGVGLRSLMGRVEGWSKGKK
ncbi:Mad3/BUB1 homology region 1-domain-containing protein [Bombardia bombarda]|uniref:Mad3/BUB1 homology region 1-domain-containing protein n=1 Tax=Bombardia bombarda TaxID=252184 RepID=A0AA40BYH1_9PEZI|nr:Mad3/BUB1 homology region 1-domain-containing protein [Bombardia bombarda]